MDDWKFLTAAALVLILIGIHCAGRQKSMRERARGITNWVCIYNEHVSTQAIARFDLAVLDSDSHPELRPLHGSKTIRVGYVSVGEVADYRWYWPRVKKADWLLEKNPQWESHFVDVRAEAWQKLLLQEVIPRVLAQGFDGVFLDTVDNAEYLQRYRQQGHLPGSEQAMIALIRKIRAQYPDIFIVMNRGFAILPQVVNQIDAVLAESVLTEYDHIHDRTTLRKEAETGAVLGSLQMAQNRGVTVLTLDYVDPADKALMQRVIAKARKLGFKPYISTLTLDSIFYYAYEGKYGH